MEPEWKHHLRKRRRNRLFPTLSMVQALETPEEAPERKDHLMLRHLTISRQRTRNVNEPLGLVPVTFVS